MTKLENKKVRCANCKKYSEQLVVYNLDFSVEEANENTDFMNHIQVCPFCGHFAINIDFNIKELIFIPFQSVGDLKFGMKRKEVRRILGGFRQLPKDLYAKNSSDSFNGVMDCYYDEEDLLNSIVVSNEITVVFNEQIIMPLKEKEFNKLFKDAKTNFDGENMTWVESLGLTSYNYNKQVSSLTFQAKEL